MSKMREWNIMSFARRGSSINCTKIGWEKAYDILQKEEHHNSK